MGSGGTTPLWPSKAKNKGFVYKAFFSNSLTGNLTSQQYVSDSLLSMDEYGDDEMVHFKFYNGSKTTEEMQDLVIKVNMITMAIMLAYASMQIHLLKDFLSDLKKTQ